MSIQPPDLEQLARAEIAKRFGGTITYAEFAGLMSIPKEGRGYFHSLCTKAENDFLLIEILKGEEN